MPALKTVQEIENRLFKNFPCEARLKIHISGLLSNVESEKGIVDKLIAIEVFKSYIIALHDVGKILDEDYFDVLTSIDVYFKVV